MSRFDWRPATVIANTRATGKMISLEIEPAAWIPHLPGQHYEIRFPGEPVSRKFSVASAPERAGTLEFGIEVLPYGLLSPRLAECAPGEPLEIRGPTGAGFTWSSEAKAPVVLIGAGSGVTPLLAMQEHHHLSASRPPLFFLLSVRNPEDLYRPDRLTDAVVTRFTSREPRLERTDLAAHLEPVLDNPETTARICGPKGFMETMIDALLALGLPDNRVRSEGFV